MKTIICTTPIDHLKGLKKKLSKKGKLIYKPNIKALELKKFLQKNKKINTIFCNPNRQGYVLNRHILENTSINEIDKNRKDMTEISKDSYTWNRISNLYSNLFIN